MYDSRAAMGGRSEQNVGWASSTGLVVTAAGLVILSGVVLTAVRLRSSNPADPPLGAFAFGALFATPGVLALLSLAARPALLLAAAAALIPLSMLSFSLVTLPLVILVIPLILAYGARSPGLSAPPSRHLLTAAVVVGLLVAAVATLLFVHQDPRTYTTSSDGRTTVRSGPEPSSFGSGSGSASSVSGSMSPGESGGGTSDVITDLESVIALGLMAAAIAAGWRLATTQQPANT